MVRFDKRGDEFEIEPTSSRVHPYLNIELTTEMGVSRLHKRDIIRELTSNVVLSNNQV